jgi:curved DNA-binding protein CbpA
MKNYYEVLGLSATATDHEIKHVFRKLAITYHPDKNPSPEAEAFFKEVNEAYEILGDPSKRLFYDQLLSGAIAVIPDESLQPWHKDPAYRKRKQAGYKPPPRGPSARMVMMESFLKYIQILSWVACGWSSLLIIDYLSPPKTSIEKIVTNVHPVQRKKLRSSGDLLVTEQGHHFPIGLHELKYFPHQSDLKIFYSPLFSLLVKVENQNSSYQLNNLATVYRNFMFAPILLVLLSVIGLIWRKGIEFRFNLGLVTFLIFLLNIGFFFISKV